MAHEAAPATSKMATKKALELGRQERERPDRRGFRQGVRTVSAQPPGRFFGGQALAVGAKGRADFGGRLRVPGGL